MEKIITQKVYNLVNSNGDKLQLRLGWLQSNRDNGVAIPVVNGWRWSFEGKKIPMPVRSRTWFNGFPEPIMLDWLKANDWVVHTIVNPCDGSAIVFELPSADNANVTTTEMETFGTEQFPAQSSLDRPAFNRIIRNLVSDGHKATACRVYRYAHGGKLSDALRAVNIIITE